MLIYTNSSGTANASNTTVHGKINCSWGGGGGGWGGGTTFQDNLYSKNNPFQKGGMEGPDLLHTDPPLSIHPFI